MDIYLPVDKEVDGAENVTLSGKCRLSSMQDFDQLNFAKVRLNQASCCNYKLVCLRERSDRNGLVLCLLCFITSKRIYFTISSINQQFIINLEKNIYKRKSDTYTLL